MPSTQNQDTKMLTKILDIPEVLAGYDAVAALYPYTPSLSHWRAWEYAAYKHCDIAGRILDVGCGDGLYFKLIWPKANNVVGVDLDPVAVEKGRSSGVYREIHLGAADSIPEADRSFDNAFANCSLEHMDRIDQVLSEISRCLKVNGKLVCSVVSNRFVEWSLLSKLVKEAGHDRAAEMLQSQFLNYHHLANPLPVADWVSSFKKAGFELELHIPILPKYNSGIFLLMDSLWHVERGDQGEMGDVIHPFLANNPRFPKAFRKIFEGLMDMENDWHDCSGAVFSLRKVR